MPCQYFDIVFKNLQNNQMDKILAPSIIEEILSEITANVNVSKLPLRHIFTKIMNNLQLYEPPNTHILDIIFSHQQIQQFMVAIYRLVVTKLIFDLVVENYQWEFREEVKQMYKTIYPTLYEFAQQKSNNIIRELYCKIIWSLKTKKFEILQFILFFTFLSSEPVILYLIKSSSNLKLYLSKKIQQPENIPVWACVMVNYLITKYKVSSEVYYGLKSKYLRKNKTQIKKKGEGLTMVQNDFKISSLEESRFAKGFPNLSQDAHCFFQEIHSIVSSSKRTVGFQLISNAKKPTQSPHISQPINLDSPIAIFSADYPRLINFPSSSNRSTIFQGSRKCQSGYKPRRLIKNMMSSTTRQGFKKGSHEQKDKKQDIMLITNSLKLMLNSRQKKKEAIKPLVKMSVQNWKDRVKHIRYQSNIQKTTLEANMRKSKIQSEGFGNQNQNLYINPHLIKKRPQNNKKQKNVLNGFVEHIEVREPKQMKIVKDIVNYTSYSPDKKGQKVIKSRECKIEYDNFLKKNALWHEYYEEDNYDYRLQKCLTGTLKL